MILCRRTLTLLVFRWSSIAVICLECVKLLIFYSFHFCFSYLSIDCFVWWNFWYIYLYIAQTPQLWHLNLSLSLSLYLGIGLSGLSVFVVAANAPNPIQIASFCSSPILAVICFVFIILHLLSLSLSLSLAVSLHLKLSSFLTLMQEQHEDILHIVSWNGILNLTAFLWKRKKWFVLQSQCESIFIMRILHAFNLVAIACCNVIVVLSSLTDTNRSIGYWRFAKQSIWKLLIMHKYYINNNLHNQENIKCVLRWWILNNNAHSGMCGCDTRIYYNKNISPVFQCRIVTSVWCAVRRHDLPPKFYYIFAQIGWPTRKPSIILSHTVYHKFWFFFHFCVCIRLLLSRTHEKKKTKK